MAKKIAATQAIRTLRDAKVAFDELAYDYDLDGSATGAAEQVAMDPDAVIKTLVLETSEGDCVLMLMHGNREVSTKALARHLGVKSVRMADAATAHKHTGYQFGGTSPFGTRRTMAVYIERTLLDHETVAINAGKRGLLVRLATTDLVALLAPSPVEVAT